MMAVNVFHTDARDFDLLSSIMAIGTLSGALLAVGGGAPRQTALLSGAAVFGLSYLLIAGAPGYWLFAVALIIIGIAALTFTNATNNLMQLSTEPAMRGRVMALRLRITSGRTPIGASTVGGGGRPFRPALSVCGLGEAAGFAEAMMALYAFRWRDYQVR